MLKMTAKSLLLRPQDLRPRAHSPTCPSSLLRYWFTSIPKEYVYLLFGHIILFVLKRICCLYRQGWNYRLVIDNRWRYFFFYRISIRLYFFTIDFQP